MMKRVSIAILLQFIVALSSCERCRGMLAEELDCTTSGGPDVAESDLTSESLGQLAEGGFQLSADGAPVSPAVPFTATLGVNQSLSLVRTGDNFQGYILRVARSGAANPFTFFLKDSIDVGTISFCSALGLLNTTGISIAPTLPLTSAGFLLFFNGGGGFEVTLDVIATTTTTGYDFYHSRYLINVEKMETSSPTSSSPSSSPSTSPTSATPTVLPTTSDSPTKAPAIELVETSLPTDQPTIPPTTSPVTEAPTTNPTQSPTSQPTSAPTVQSDPPTLHPTTTEPTTSPTGSPVAAVATTIAPTTSSPTGSPVQVVQTTPGPSTTSPTHVPTQSPVKIVQTTQSPTTTQPSLVPTVEPVASEPTDTDSTFAPTSKPTSIPTLTPEGNPVLTSILSANYENLLLTLEGVARLDGPAQGSFILTTQAWYQSIYNDPESRFRRRLQESGIVEFSTTVTMRSQTDGDNAITLAYDQFVSYREQGANPSANPLDVILSPFDDPVLVENYLRELRDSNPAFENIPAGSMVTPDGSSILSPSTDNPDDDGGDDQGSILIVAALAGVVVILIVIVAAVFLYRRRKNKADPKSREDQDEVSLPISAPPPPAEEGATTELIIGEDEISALYEPSIGAYSYDAEQSMSTVDYDYSKVASGGGNRSVVSSAGGTLGENTMQDSLTQTTPTTDRFGRWTSMSSKLLDDEPSTYTVAAPAGKLGVVVDTPDEGAPVIHAVKDTSVLHGKVHVGDRLLAVDDEDVSTMSAVNISRLISKKAHAQVRTFTLRKSQGATNR
eukprot:CAMPEP_0172446684 /NCGR_PEP_ID=MMETSP1065-20121228/6229_1 /TAXON_ID=265537 /ORGANISM="Amphiprora paludosa, Strain CCMP125" /LENGTH=783 /DNA_ID=CAMNT_0013197873 /DNA_START=22 /DNA_END=2373 /DNA_ORIENTATION=+